jgi:hypothetical protein
MFDPYKTCRASTGAWSISGVPHRRHTTCTRKAVNVRVVPTSDAIDESVDLAYDIFIRVFSRSAEKISRKESSNGRVRALTGRKAALPPGTGASVSCPSGHPSILGAIHRPLTDFHAVPIRRHFRCLGEQRSFESIAVVLNTLKLIFPSHHFRLSSSALASAGPITPSPKCSFNQSSNSY